MDARSTRDYVAKHGDALKSPLQKALDACVKAKADDPLTFFVEHFTKLGAAQPNRTMARRAPAPGSEDARAQALVSELAEKHGQAHLAAGWSAEREEDQRRLERQLLALHASLPAGGLPGYIGRARELLRASREGTARLSGYTPSVPSGHALQLGSADFLSYEAAGAAASRGLGLVLVAGGLGERLGYSGAKLCLPPELLSGRPYLGLYAAHILALQARALHYPRPVMRACIVRSLGDAPPACCSNGPARAPQELNGPGSPPLPLVIMTSDDTHARSALSCLAPSPASHMRPPCAPTGRSRGAPRGARQLWAVGGPAAPDQAGEGAVPRRRVRHARRLAVGPVRAADQAARSERRTRARAPLLPRSAAAC